MSGISSCMSFVCITSTTISEFENINLLLKRSYDIWYKENIKDNNIMLDDNVPFDISELMPLQHPVSLISVIIYQIHSLLKSYSYNIHELPQNVENIKIFISEFMENYCNRLRDISILFSKYKTIQDNIQDIDDLILDRKETIKNLTAVIEKSSIKIRTLEYDYEDIKKNYEKINKKYILEKEGIDTLIKKIEKLNKEYKDSFDDILQDWEVYNNIYRLFMIH